MIVNTDADNQYSGADIPKLLAPILAGEADMVVGDRQVAQIEHFSGAKKALQRIGSWVVRRLSGTAIADTTSGFRAYNREAALRLLVVDNFTYTLESLIQAGKMLVAVGQVEVETNPQTRESRLFDSTGAYVAATRSRSCASTPATSRCACSPPPASSSRMLALAAWMPFLLDWILNGDSTGHIQSLILGAVLFIAAVQLFALGVIGDLLAGQRVMTQRVFERVRRVELALGVAPSHYEPGARSADPAAGASLGLARRLGGSATADYGKTAGFLAIGVGLTGVITYAYFFIASHVLSKADYGQITVLWSAVFITVSTLYRPVDQLLSRHISENLARANPIGQPVRVAARIQLGLALDLRRGRARPARAAAERPARGQRVALLDLRLGGPLYAASCFARRYVAGTAASSCSRALILSESCSAPCSPCSSRSACWSGQSAVAVGIVAAPVPLADGRAACLPRQAETPAVLGRRRVEGASPRCLAALPPSSRWPTEPASPARCC